MTELPHFAILAPVPLEHLKSGLLVAEKLLVAENKAYVAFGSMKWELFSQIDEMRQGSRVAILIYPSHEGTEGKDAFIVTWFGWYIGFVQSRNGAHPDNTTHRPQTTFDYPADNRGHWAVFWHVEGLRELSPEKRLPIGKIAGFKGGVAQEQSATGSRISYTSRNS